MAKHLTLEERDRIADLKSRGFAQAAIAKALGRSPSVISREVRISQFGRRFFSAVAIKSDHPFLALAMKKRYTRVGGFCMPVQSSSSRYVSQGHLDLISKDPPGLRRASSKLTFRVGRSGSRQSRILCLSALRMERRPIRWRGGSVAVILIFQACFPGSSNDTSKSHNLSDVSRGDTICLRRRPFRRCIR